MRTVCQWLCALTLLDGVCTTASFAEVSIQVEGLLVVTECRGADYRQISTSSATRSIIEIAASCVRMGAPVAVLTDPETRRTALHSGVPLKVSGALHRTLRPFDRQGGCPAGGGAAKAGNTHA